MNRDLGFFVKALGLRDRIEIFHYLSKTFKIIEGPRKEEHPFEIKRAKGRSSVILDFEYPFGYVDAEIGDRYIYALYSGLTDSQMMNSSDFAKTVFVFTHAGELIGRFDLDISVRSIAVDEKLEDLYGIRTDRNPGRAVFKIPEDLLN